MEVKSPEPNRRKFLAGIAGVGAAAVGLTAAADSPSPSAVPTKNRIKLGMDNYSVRAMGWKAPELLDYAASLKLDVILMSDLDVYESFEPAYLKKIKEHADSLGVAIHVGTGSICPTSSYFNTKHGTAEEHLGLAIRVAQALGSPVVRCVLGSGADRTRGSGIEEHMENTVKVCKALRSRAVDAGVKIAIENHAGDMQAWELVTLIEAAGKDYVGATMDSGNPIWTVEDPMKSLETLGPYAVTTGIRDSAVWKYEEGALGQWTAMGDGHVEMKAYAAKFAQLCPATPFILEIISGGPPRKNPYLREEFWKPYPKARASEFARFVAMAERGKPYVTPSPPQGKTPEESTQLLQKSELEKSVRYCRETLGLGGKS